jgi:hypothetical protein
MAKLRSTTNQGARLGGKAGGKVTANAVAANAGAANVKRAQSGGKGLAQARGAGSKHVESNSRGGKVGLKQNATGAKKPAATAKKPNKLNKAPISAQPKSPKNLKNKLNLRNSVSRGDVARLRKASNLSLPAGALATKGGGFGSFLGK